VNFFYFYGPQNKSTITCAPVLFLACGTVEANDNLMIPGNIVTSYEHHYPQVTFSGIPVINKLADHSNKCAQHISLGCAPRDFYFPLIKW